MPCCLNTTAHSVTVTDEINVNDSVVYLCIPFEHLQVANAMATRAKQLQADLQAARSELATMSDRCDQLEEENARLHQELVEGMHAGPTDAEEQVRMLVLKALVSILQFRCAPG